MPGGQRVGEEERMFFWCAFLLSFPYVGGMGVPIRPVRPVRGQDYGIFMIKKAHHRSSTHTTVGGEQSVLAATN